MTDSERALLREDEQRWLELDEKATPGPWKFGEIVRGDERRHGGFYTFRELSAGAMFWIARIQAFAHNLIPPDDGYEETLANAEFMAESRTAFPLLLERLIAERQKQRWIPCSERLPKLISEGGKPVLIETAFGSVTTAVWTGVNWYWSDVTWRQGDVICWMPMPESSKAESRKPDEGKDAN